MEFEQVDGSQIPTNKWDKLINALKNLPKGKAIRLDSDKPQSDASGIRQRVYHEIGSGKFSILTNESEVYIKHMD